MISIVNKHPLSVYHAQALYIEIQEITNHLYPEFLIRELGKNTQASKGVLKLLFSMENWNRLVSGVFFSKSIHSRVTKGL